MVIIVGYIHSSGSKNGSSSAEPGVGTAAASVVDLLMRTLSNLAELYKTSPKPYSIYLRATMIS